MKLQTIVSSEGGMRNISLNILEETVWWWQRSTTAGLSLARHAWQPNVEVMINVDLYFK